MNLNKIKSVFILTRHPTTQLVHLKRRAIDVSSLGRILMVLRLDLLVYTR